MAQGKPSVNEVKAAIDGDVVAKADEHGIDVDALVAEEADKWGSYGPASIAKFASSRISDEIQADQMDHLTGIALGSRDRFGHNWPRKTSLIRSDGQHQKVSTWSGELDGPDGNPTRMPHGHIVTLAAEYSADFDARGEWQGEAIRDVDRLEADDLIEKVATVATEPAAISQADQPTGDKRGAIVCVRGPVRWVSPFPLFEDGDPAGDGDVLMGDGDGTRKPHFAISIAADGGYRVTGNFERQEHGNPFIHAPTEPGDPDFGQVLADATNLGGPEAQTEFLRNYMDGWDVALIGEVTRVEPTTTKDGESVTYVDISLSGMVRLDATAADAEPADDEDAPMAQLVARIRDASEVQGVDPSALDVATVREQFGVGDDVDDVAITHAIREIGGETEGDTSSEPETGAERDAGDLSELVNESGMYLCPAECLAQFPEADELREHVADAHPEVDL